MWSLHGTHNPFDAKIFCLARRTGLGKELGLIWFVLDGEWKVPYGVRWERFDKVHFVYFLVVWFDPHCRIPGYHS